MASSKLNSEGIYRIESDKKTITPLCKIAASPILFDNLIKSQV